MTIRRLHVVGVRLQRNPSLRRQYARASAPLSLVPHIARCWQSQQFARSCCAPIYCCAVSGQCLIYAACLYRRGAQGLLL